MSVRVFREKKKPIKVSSHFMATAVHFSMAFLMVFYKVVKVARNIKFHHNSNYTNTNISFHVSMHES